MPKIRNRVFKYVDFGENGHEENIITEQEIVEQYWPYWHKKIWEVDTPNTRKIRDLPLSLEIDRCVDDFLVGHWATEIKDDNTT